LTLVRQHASEEPAGELQAIDVQESARARRPLTEDNFDPFGQRPRVRTTDDYLRKRGQAEPKDNF
jgi:hypothetical protein